MGIQSLVRPATFRAADADSRERRATWLELFFDLVFVVAVAQLAHVLHDDLTVGGFLRFAGLFAPVWWSWMSYTYLADQFDNDDLVHRIALFTAMFFIAALATFIHVGMHDSATGFALCYVALRLIVTGLYARAWLDSPEARPLCARFLLGNGAGALIWVSSLLVHGDGRYAIWAIALTVEIVTPIAAIRSLRRGPVSNISHIPERMGLFVLIVLGETVVAVADGVSSTAWDTRGVVGAAAALVLASGLWWLYFAELEGVAIRRRLLWAFIYPYAHFPIFVALVTIGVAAEFAIGHATDDHLSTPVRVALGGGVAGYLIALTAVQFGSTVQLGARRVVLRTFSASACVLFAFTSGSITPPTVIAGFAAIVVLLVAAEPRRVESHSAPA